MNRLIARPVVQLARRPLISSAETGGHAWYRTGFTAFKSHPSIFRYLGKFKPLHDRVLIEVLDSSEKTAGGIIIPDTAQEKPQEGKVVAVGGGAKTEDGKTIPMDVKVGDKVLFGKWSGTEVKIDGKEYSIMKESDIMGISSK